MSTHETQGCKSGNRWTVPVTAAVIGVIYLVVGLIGGQSVFAWSGFALMLVIGAAFWWASGRNETVAFLANRRDERINRIDLVASQFAGSLVLAAVLVMFVVEIARGRDGSPYYQLAALGGVSYVAALVWLRFRR